LQRAILRVSRDFSLAPDWINTAIARQWSQGLPPWLPNDITWRRYGGLHIGLVGRRTLFALKLFATVDQSVRSVHAQDLVALEPSDAELEEAAAWVVTQDASDPFRGSSRRWWSMPERIDELASIAGTAATNAVWRQWSLLGAPIAGASVVPRSVIDPEALLLLSVSIRASERRLDDVLGWWAVAGSTLLSVQRTSTLLRRFPPSARAGVASFAVAAVEAGDNRWSTLARAAGDGSLASRGKRGREPRLAPYPALMLRLRAGFGVGVKADLLGILLAMGGSDATVRSLSQASGYTPAAVRRAAQEMEAAAFIRGTHSRPATYYVDSGRWLPLLDGSGMASSGEGWRSFAQVFAFLAWVGAWGDEQRDASPYVASSAARDLYEAHRTAFELNRIRVPDPAESTGAAYLDDFAATVRTLSEWLQTNL
jgi:hypothetical protein